MDVTRDSGPKLAATTKGTMWAACETRNEQRHVRNAGLSAADDDLLVGWNEPDTISRSLSDCS